jgi:hypothetical protein
MGKGAQNPGHHVTWMTTFCMVAPNIFGSSVWNLLHDLLLATRILRWLLDFSKICVPTYRHSFNHMFTKCHTFDLIFEMVKDLLDTWHSQYNGPCHHELRLNEPPISFYFSELEAWKCSRYPAKTEVTVNVWCVLVIRDTLPLQITFLY